MSSHIAREGETEYASLYCRRSGQDAGEIEYGIRVSEVDNLPPHEKQELARVARRLAESIERYAQE